jgi:hypothetical protein
MTKKKNGNWFTKMIKEDSTLPKLNECSSSEQEDSDDAKGFFVGSTYHEAKK